MNQGTITRRRIFVVEDEALIMMELRDRLEKLNYEVCGNAARAEAALKRIAELQPDLVLMDINLAGAMNGVEAARQLRENGGPPVVFLTAYSDPELIARASTEGAFGYLVKPFQERELYATIEVALERKRAEIGMRELNAELESRVKERTASLEAVNAELEALNYSVAHDLKGPLRGIEGYSRLVLESSSAKLDATAGEYLENIRRAAKQMSAMLDGLLDYSRLGRHEISLVKLEIKGLIRSLLESFSEEIERCGASVSVTVPFSELSADRELLGIALRGLVGNALKFTRDSSSPAMEIGGREETGKWILWVRDNGPGFDMQYREKVFGIFQRLHRAEDHPGAGVGLAMVRRAMDRMGGRTWTESAPGMGATFFLEIEK